MLNYLQMYPETMRAVQRYPEDARCRLYEAMMVYAFTGEEPDWPAEALEWLVWESLRQRVDAANELAEKRAAAGSRGGATSKPKQTEANESKTKQTEANESKPKPEAEAEAETDAEADAEKLTKQARAREAEERFERFWQAYPRKVDRKDAHRVFMRINPDEAKLTAMLASLAKWKASDQWTRDGERYIPHPTTWLNGERWNDEPPAPRPAAPQVIGKPVAAQQYSQRSYAQENDDELPSWFADRAKAAGILA